MCLGHENQLMLYARKMQIQYSAQGEQSEPGGFWRWSLKVLHNPRQPREEGQDGGSLQVLGRVPASQPIPNNGKKPQRAWVDGNLKWSQAHGYQNQIFNLQLRHPLLKATERQYSIMVKNADPGARLCRFQSHPKDLASGLYFSFCFCLSRLISWRIDLW